MRKIIGATVMLVIGVVLSACSDTQLASFKQRVGNFEAGVLTVNQAIGNISPALLQNCNNILSVTSLLVPIAAGTKYAADANAAEAVINTYCQAPPVANIQGVVALTAQAYVNARAAYDAANGGK